MAEEKKIYSVSDIQRILKLSRNAAYKFVQECYQNQKPFRVIKIGREYKIPVKSFDNWLNGN